MLKLTFRIVLLSATAAPALVCGVANAQTAAPPPRAPPASVSEVVVTAPRLESTARQVQASAPNIVNVQSGETIAKYPDFNAAEALGRIPGVSLSTDTGEGRFVNIRGIDANLNGATFGGVVLLNTQPGGTVLRGGRAVEFDTVPVGAIDRLEVFKTGLPEREAEGIGGSVELSPRSAITAKRFFFEGQLGVGYEPLRETDLFRDEIVIGGRFGLKPGAGPLGLGLLMGGDEAASPRAGFFSNPTPFSFVFTQFQLNDRRGIDDVEAGYSNSQPDQPDKVLDALELRRYQYHRRRFGYSGELDFEPNDNHRYYVRGSIAGYIEGVNRARLFFDNLEFSPNPDPAGDPLLLTPAQLTDPNNRNGYLAPFAVPHHTLRDEQETHRNSVYAAGGVDTFGPVTLDYQVAYSRATYHKSYDRNTSFDGPTTPLAYDNNSNPDLPTYRVLNGTNVNDSRLFPLTGFQNSTEDDVDEEWSYAANLTYRLHLFADDDRIKIGFKARLRDKTAAPISYNYDTGALTQTLADFQGMGPIVYYDGAYNIGYSPNGVALAKFFRTQTPTVDLARNARAFFNDTENVYAGYGQYQTTIGRYGLLAGVRVEATDDTYRGLTQTVVAGRSALPSDFQPSTRHQSYVDVFPTVQLRYEFAPKLIGRLTYSTGISRPGFVQTSAATQVDTGNSRVTTGNPNLQPTFANNFDASVEYYLPHAGIVSLGLFDKEIDNYIVQLTRTAPYPGFSQNVRINTYDNVPSAFARGVEAAYAQKFTALPAPFNGLGFEANVTYVDSQVELRAGSPRLLPGTSRWTGNGAILYEAYRIQARLAAEYISKSLFGIGGSSATDVIQDDKLNFDFTSSYAVTPQVALYFNAKNLTDDNLRYYEGAPNRPIQREFYGVTLETGVRARF